ncbi:hypothetical protein QA646_25280 (plasmid) [Rhizobium sp. CB3090]|uniref:hypothetical protein n=1 Tax=Rhizobium sp. CB3090 TaxID=3039156 RepID=UPI0024B14B3B|nr:hypothetical protein [Rhizobium sp. CB3090]WFU11696.1 hypothetical protein QA646_25280 [Rhizobium sp. CB3090]
MRQLVQSLNKPRQPAELLPAFASLAEIVSRTDALQLRRKEPDRGKDLAVITGRQLNGAAAILALSVLVDSAVEHYRGSFQNKVMYAPLAVSSLTLITSLAGIADRQPKRHPVRDTIYAFAGITGLAGLGFHAYNILKRPGGLSWLNLFYSAPIGAPIALLLSGGFGRAAEKVRDTSMGKLPTIIGLPAGMILTVAACLGLLGTVGEAALLHFRGAFQNRAMYLPVTIPPTAAILLGRCLFATGRSASHLARIALKITSALGLAGAGFHIYGVSRNMGGWRNWSQNVLNGPPIPAPPSFTGLAIAGLAALSLLEVEKNREGSLPRI